jgi:hypothetical protein
MGTFDETAIVGYHLSFADKGKQTPVFCFCLKQTNGSSPFPFPFAENKQKLPFSISPVFRLRKHREMETWRNGNMETWRPRTWRHQMDNGAQAIFLNPFDVCSSCKRKLVVYPFAGTKTNGIYMFANGLNRLNGLDHLCCLILVFQHTHGRLNFCFVETYGNVLK